MNLTVATLNLEDGRELDLLPGLLNQVPDIDILLGPGGAVVRFHGAGAAVPGGGTGRPAGPGAQFPDP
jgi:hypothetical protein